MNLKLITFILLLISSLGFLAAQTPEIEMIDYETFEARVNQKSDEFVLYNFWATWCGPCVKELPEFEKLNQEYADKKVKVVFVSLDFANMKEAVEEFVARKELKAEVILLNAPDYNAWIDKVSPEWSGAIPATLMVNSASGIREFKETSFTYESLVEWVDEVVGTNSH
jgi:thiol-disulfide isomerase/thioredoxin